jgi:hypothetical protein
VKLGRSADALSVGAAKLVVSLAVLAAGFHAVSDDDYARTVIAQRFAAAPSLDPSGTSWLPLPFWLYGAAFRLFGGSLGVARTVAVVLGIGSVWLLLVAARWLGAGRLGALAGALVAALFPWSAWLGAAPVPELPTAALSVLATAALALSDARVRLFGAVAVASACFCRYEAWPIALVFAAFSTWDAFRCRDRALWLAAGLALGPIVLWLLHGVFVHGDALFFWKRVADYRHALGEGPSFRERLLSVPGRLFGDEPELWLGLLLVGVQAASLERYARPAVAAGALLIFLVAGELGGGGPTHHTGRAVLPVWLLVALALGHELERRAAEPLGKPWILVVLALSMVGLGWVLRVGTPPAFPDRRDAVAIGTEARTLGAGALLIDAPDYSYLAVSAAFGAPHAAEPFDDRDPRHARAADAFTSESTLRARAAKRSGAWLVVTREHLPLARRLGRVRAETPTFALVEPGANLTGRAP